MSRQHFFPYLRLRLLCSRLFVISIFLTGCQGFSATGGPGPLVKDNLSAWRDSKASLGTINEIVVMPLEGEAARKLGADLQQQISFELSRAFELTAGLEVMNLTKKSTVQQSLEAAGQGPQVSRASRFGTHAGAQGVLYGILTRYEGPQHRRAGSGQPSAASFRIWLVPSGSTEPIWSATYDNVERPLSENLFLLPGKLKSGVGYKGRLDLLKQGFSEAALALHSMREEERLRSNGSTR